MSSRLSVLSGHFSQESSRDSALVASSTSQASSLQEVVVVGMARTPIGGLNGSLSSFTAPQLGSIAIKGALNKAGLDPTVVEEVFMGHVLSGGVGQAPARQAALGAGLGKNTPCTAVNKVCASGMKALMIGAQAIATGQRSCVVVGGMESMSNVPFYLPQARQGYRMGHKQALDGMIHDGLWDAYNNVHMGSAAEMCSQEYKISRQDQDDYAIASYKRAQEASKSHKFKEEIVPVQIKDRKGNVKTITEDDEVFKVDFQRVPSLPTSFKKQDGTVTAANSSTISDGAAALVLMSRRKAEELGVPVLAMLKGMADAATNPLQFPIAPALAIPMALKQANVKESDVDLYEINEAFSVVCLANMKRLNIPHDKINVLGGAVALGHPIGCSGARIVITLISALQQSNKQTGVAAVCNGGGGASAVVLRRAN